MNANTAPTGFAAATPPPTTVGVAYAYTFVADGAPPLIYSLSSGKLPDGRALDRPGALHGTPTAVGTTTVTVSAQNGFGPNTTNPVKVEVITSANE